MVIPLPPYLGDSIDVEELEGVSGGSAAKFIKDWLLGGQLGFLVAVGYDFISGDKDFRASDKVEKWINAPIQ